MFGIFSGRSSTDDELQPTAKVASESLDVPRNISDSEDSRFKWGKNKTLTRPTRSSSPIELLESHFLSDPQPSKDDTSITTGMV